MHGLGSLRLYRAVAGSTCGLRPLGPARPEQPLRVQPAAARRRCRRRAEVPAGPRHPAFRRPPRRPGGATKAEGASGGRDAGAGDSAGAGDVGGRAGGGGWPSRERWRQQPARTGARASRGSRCVAAAAAAAPQPPRHSSTSRQSPISFWPRHLLCIGRMKPYTTPP